MFFRQFLCGKIAQKLIIFDDQNLGVFESLGSYIIRTRNFRDDPELFFYFFCHKHWIERRFDEVILDPQAKSATDLDQIAGLRTDHDRKFFFPQILTVSQFFENDESLIACRNIDDRHIGADLSELIVKIAFIAYENDATPESSERGL